MNIIIKRFAAFIVSLCLILAPMMPANAASSWNVSSSVSAGSRAIVTASKAGYKGAVNIAPTAGRLGLRLVKGANWAALAYAAIQLAPPLADLQSFQPDYANNRVKYDVLVPAIGKRYKASDGSLHVTAAAAAALNCSIAGLGSVLGHVETFSLLIVSCSGGRADGTVIAGAPETKKPEYISIPAAAAQMIANAKNGHAPSQAAIAQTATEMVGSGAFDADLLSGAVPINDSRPLVPSVPISGVDNLTIGDDGLMNGELIGADVDAQIEAAKDAKRAAEAATEAAKEAAESARRANDDAEDVINSAVDQALKDAAKAAADAATKAAKDLADVSDRAKEAAKEAAGGASRGADKAKELADKALEDAKKAYEEAGTEDKAKADEAVKEAEKEATKAKERADEAEKALDKAKAEAAKPFELPAFCSWAKPVCDAVDWLMKPAPDLGEDSELDVTVPDVTPADTDINFSGSCPANFVFNGSIFGNSISMVLLDTQMFCNFLSTYVKYPVYAASSLFAIFILGGRKNG